MNLVSLVVTSPYPKIVEPLRDATAPFREGIEFRYWGDLPSSEGKRAQFMKLILNQQMRLGYAAVETKSKRKLT